MTTCWSRILLAIICLFVLATLSQAAEGAWVLWTQETATRPELLTPDEKEWRRMAAFDSKSACVSDASARAEALASLLGAVPEKGRRLEIQRYREDYLAVKTTFSGGMFDGVSMWTFYQCWPDTVDPRGRRAHNDRRHLPTRVVCRAFHDFFLIGLP